MTLPEVNKRGDYEGISLSPYSQVLIEHRKAGSCDCELNGAANREDENDEPGKSLPFSQTAKVGR